MNLKEFSTIWLTANIKETALDKQFCEFVKYLHLKEDDVNYFCRVISLDKESEEYAQIMSTAEKFGLKAIEHHYQMKYTAKEINSAMYFEMFLGIYGKNDYTQSYQTKLVDNYCSKCNNHLLFPDKEVYINKNEFKGKDIATSMNGNYEIIVSDKMKKLIEEAKLTGIIFYPAYHYKEDYENDYPAWRMAVQNIMPPIDKNMPVNIIDGYCDVCQNHHILPLSYVRYKKSELEKATDFNISCEAFSGGWMSSPKLIISRKVYNLIKTNKIHGCKFEIVGIVTDFN